MRSEQTVVDRKRGGIDLEREMEEEERTKFDVMWRMPVCFQAADTFSFFLFSVFCCVNCMAFDLS